MCEFPASVKVRAGSVKRSVKLQSRLVRMLLFVELFSSQFLCVGPCPNFIKEYYQNPMKLPWRYREYLPSKFAICGPVPRMGPQARSWWSSERWWLFPVYFGWFWNISYHFVQFHTIPHNFTWFGILSVNFGLFGTIWDYFGLFWTIWEHFRTIVW